jgi:hypothetical protein
MMFQRFRVSVFGFQGQHLQCLTPESDETGRELIKGKIEIELRGYAPIGMLE